MSPSGGLNKPVVMSPKDFMHKTSLSYEVAESSIENIIE